MYKEKFADLELTVLDKSEFTKVTAFVQKSSNSCAAAMSDIQIDTDTGPYSAYELYIGAQTFSDDNDTCGSVYGNGSGFMKALDKIKVSFPNFFNIPYTQACVLGAMIDGPASVSNYLINNPDHIKEHAEVKDILQQNLLWFEKVRDLAQESKDLYDPAKNKIFDAFITQIDGMTSSSYTAQAYFLAGMDGLKVPFNERPDILSIAQCAVDIYERLFREEPFLEKRDAATIVSNYANSLKFFADDPEILEKGLNYYKSAQKVLKKDPNVAQGIKFYEGQQTSRK